MHAAPHLELIVPGLAGPESSQPVTDCLDERPAALDRLLSRSRCVRTGAHGLDEALLRRFGLALDGALPVAALTGRADLDTLTEGCLLRADPVHLRADQSSLRLFESHGFDLSQQEADTLVASINAFNSAPGWQLEAPVPQRWYLRLPEAPALITAAPYQVAGRNIDAFLPAGPDARHWRVMMNELQMFLHTHPVNTARAQRGAPLINSLWFWGNGTPGPVAGSRPDAVYGTHPLAVGLARHAMLKQHAQPGNAQALLEQVAGGHVLVVLDILEWPAIYNDMEHWITLLDELEQDWFKPLLAALANGGLRSLALDPCTGLRFHTGPWQQRAFWQPVRRYEELLSA